MKNLFTFSKKIRAIGAGFLFASTTMYSQNLATYTFTNAGSANPINGSNLVDVTSSISLGAGLNRSAYLTNEFAATGQTATTYVAANAGNDYISLKVTPNSGKKITITSLKLRPVSQNQIRTFDIRVSSDNFATSSQAGSFTSSLFTGAPVNTINVTSCVDKTTTVEFRIYIYGQTNTYEEVGFGNRTSGTDPDICVVGTSANASATTAPAAPTNLSASNITQTSFTFNWNVVPNAVSYQVSRSGVFVANVTTNYTNITGLTAGTSYSMTVKALNSANIFSTDAVLVVTTSAASGGGGSQTLGKASNLGSSSITNNSIQLTWWSVPNATKYKIYQNGTNIGTTANSWTNYNVTGLSVGTTYSFTVQACDNSNNFGPQSDAYSVATTGTAGGGGGTNTGCMAVGANLTGDYQWTSDGTDGKVFNPNVANWNTVTDPWNPAFLADINATGYKALRFMDWNSTNWSKQTTWSTRTLKTANHLNYAQWAGTPIAYEWMIDLCNRTNKHMWVNVPHQADANYMTQLATLIKNNLNASLNVYVEYSNETWNGTFGDRNGMPGQYTYCIANSSALPGSNETYRSQAFHTKKSCEVFKAFNDVFVSAKSRVKKVIATYGNDDVSRHMLEMLDNTSINPNGLRPDLFAIAPYIGSGRDGGASNAIQQFKDDVNTAAATGGIVAKFKERLTTYNNAHPNNKMLFICYEGGSHYFGAGENPKAFYENPGSYDAYLFMLNEWKKHFNLFMQFVHRDKVDQYSAWGAKKYYGEPNSSAHKYRAIADFISSNACGAPREGSDEVEISTSSVLLVPNPASQKVTVTAETGEVSIMNLNGTVLASKSSDGSSVEFDLTGFTSGIYLVKSGSKVAKLVVE